MNRETNIWTSIELPCSFKLSGTDRKFVHGVTEFLTRESLTALIPQATPSEWLNDTARLLVAVDLPCTGLSEPRVLECAVSIICLRPSRRGTRVDAKVNRMKFKNREKYLQLDRWTGARQFRPDLLPAVEKSRFLQHVIALHHTNLTNQGENNMSFLKNFFVEEDGQDMVEYGLVIALVVLAAVALLGTFKGSIATAFGAIGTKVTTNIQ